MVLVGDNGAGKTNLLEAVSLLGAGQGLRGRPYERALPGRTAPAAWPLPPRSMSLEGVVEIGTGFGLSAARAKARAAIVRIAGKDTGAGALAHYVKLVWLIPAMDGLFTGACIRAAPLPRPAGARHRSQDAQRRIGHYDRAMRQRNRLFQMREG